MARIAASHLCRHAVIMGGHCHFSLFRSFRSQIQDLRNRHLVETGLHCAIYSAIKLLIGFHRCIQVPPSHTHLLWNAQATQFSFISILCYFLPQLWSNRKHLAPLTAVWSSHLFHSVCSLKQSWCLSASTTAACTCQPKPCPLQAGSSLFRSRSVWLHTPGVSASATPPVQIWIEVYPR